MAAKGDELLDWKEMVDFYSGAHQLVLEGGDHGISDYSKYLPQVLKFIQPSTSTQANPKGLFATEFRGEEKILKQSNSARYFCRLNTFSIGAFSSFLWDPLLVAIIANCSI